MSAISLNGTTYDGAGGNPKPPSKIAKKRYKVGVTKIMANGLRVFISGSAVKQGWVLSWETIDDTTRNAVAAVESLNTSFTFVDQFGVSKTVQCEGDEQSEDTVFTTAANAILYAAQLTMWQAD